MDFLLFLLILGLIFGGGFIVAGLQIAFALALFLGLFFGVIFLGALLFTLSLAPALLLAALFFIGWVIRRLRTHPSDMPRQLALPMDAERAYILDRVGIVLSWIVWLVIPIFLLVSFYSNHHFTESHFFMNL